METRTIGYAAGGATMTGFLADGSAGRRVPGVLVAHEATGMGDFVKARAEMLARLGYVAFALDLYGGAFPPEEAAERHATMMSTPGLMFSRAAAALATLGEQANVDPDRLAAIGFCQGGITAMELARGGLPIRCAVGFHPGLTRPAGSGTAPITAKVLMMVGDDDPIAPEEDRLTFAAEMRAAKADWQLLTMGGVGHTYTNPAVDAFGLPGFAYDERADRRSWALMKEMLAEVFDEAAQPDGPV